MYVSFVYVAIGIFGTLTLKAPSDDFMADYVSTGANVTSKKQYTLQEALKVKELYTLTGLYFCAVPAYLLLSAIFVTYGADGGRTHSRSERGCGIGYLLCKM